MSFKPVLTGSIVKAASYKSVLAGGYVQAPNLKPVIGGFVSVTVSSGRTILASSVMTLDSNIDTGGGTDITTILNSTLAGLNPGDTLILDGYGLVSGTILRKEKTRFIGNGVATSGLFLATNSNCLFLQNTNLSGTTVTDDAGGAWGNFTLNQNFPNQAKYEQNDSVNNFWSYAVWTGGCSGTTILETVVRNAITFCFVFSNWSNITVTGTLTSKHDVPNNNYPTTSNNWDCIHLFGPGNGLTIPGWWHNGDDDGLGLNTNEGVALYNAFPSMFGRARYPSGASSDLTNIQISNGWLENAVSAVRIYYYVATASSSTVTNMKLSNIRGQLYDGSNWTDDACPHIVSLEIDGWRVAGANDIIIQASDSLTMNSVSKGSSISVAGTSTAGDYFSLGAIPQQFGQWDLADLNDSLGQYNLTNNGGATFGAGGLIGNCATLNGSSSYLTQQLAGSIGYPTANTHYLSPATVDFSITGWVNINSVTATPCVASQWGYDPTSHAVEFSWIMYVDGTSINFGVYNTLNAFVQASATQPALSQWHMVTAQIDQTGNTIKLKVDDGAWQTASGIGTLHLTTLPLTMGCNFQDVGAVGAPSFFLDGKLNIWRMYRGLISDAQVTALYNGGAGTLSPV